MRSLICFSLNKFVVNFFTLLFCCTVEEKDAKMQKYKVQNCKKSVKVQKWKSTKGNKLHTLMFLSLFSFVCLGIVPLQQLPLPAHCNSAPRAFVLALLSSFLLLGFV